MSLVAAALALALLPATARARPPKGYTKTLRTEIAKHVGAGVKPTDVRYRSEVDKTHIHGPGGHQHIAPHEPRNVFWRVGRATGTAKTDTQFGRTTVLEIEIDEIAPNQKTAGR